MLKRSVGGKLAVFAPVFLRALVVAKSQVSVTFVTSLIGLGRCQCNNGYFRFGIIVVWAIW